MKICMKDLLLKHNKKKFNSFFILQDHLKAGVLKKFETQNSHGMVLQHENDPIQEKFTLSN
jgi:hypothetical protein